MQGKRVELQRQNKKQGGSTGKRPANLSHRVLLLCMGDSGCLGWLGRGHLLQECKGGQGFLAPAEVEQAGAIAGSWQGGVAGRQQKEGSLGKPRHADGSNVFQEMRERKAANEKETSWVRLQFLLSFFVGGCLVCALSCLYVVPLVCQYWLPREGWA